MTFTPNTHQSIVAANQTLCLNSYVDFKRRFSRISEYKFEDVLPLVRNVSSIKHIGAKIRRCTRDTISSDFRCIDCGPSKSRILQCEHSLVANNSKFIKEQFAICHMRHKIVSGLCECGWSNEDEEESLVGVDYLLPKKLDATHVHPSESAHGKCSAFSSSIPSNPQQHCLLIQNTEDWESHSLSEVPIRDVKPLSFKEFKDAMSDVLPTYNTCSNDTKFEMSSMLLKLQD